LVIKRGILLGNFKRGTAIGTLFLHSVILTETSTKQNNKQLSSGE